VWRPLCERRWLGFFRREAWLTEAEAAAAATAVPGAAASGHWRAQFDLKEASMCPALGVFAMRASLRLGRAFGMHWFEPRYKLLARRTQDSSDKLMCYSPGPPAVGAAVFLCRLEGADIAADGQADVRLVPVARGVIREAWSEPVPGAPTAPRLACARVEELPNLPGAGRGRGGGGGGGGGGGSSGGGGEDDDHDEDDDDDADDDEDDEDGGPGGMHGAVMGMMIANARRLGLSSMDEVLASADPQMRQLLGLMAALQGGGGGVTVVRGGVSSGGGSQQEEEDEDDADEDGSDGENNDGGREQHCPSSHKDADRDVPWPLARPPPTIYPLYLTYVQKKRVQRHNQLIVKREVNINHRF
jgi:uncharacterized membrane protein YgcG